MRCPKCQNLVEPEAQFCDECGERVLRASSCPGCGSAVQSGERFCGICGQPLAEPRASLPPPAANTVRPSRWPRVQRRALLFWGVGGVLTVVVLLSALKLFRAGGDIVPAPGPAQAVTTPGSPQVEQTTTIAPPNHSPVVPYQEYSGEQIASPAIVTRSGAELPPEVKAALEQLLRRESNPGTQPQDLISETVGTGDTLTLTPGSGTANAESWIEIRDGVAEDGSPQ